MASLQTNPFILFLILILLLLSDPQTSESINKGLKALFIR